MRKIITISALVIFAFSCKEENKITKKEIILGTKDSNVINKNNTLILADDTLQNGISISYNENKGIIGVVLDRDKESFISIGKYHNTFNQPPHEIDIKKITNQKYLIFVFTNQVQLGISQDELNV
jgi:hypothetical protein